MIFLLDSLREADHVHDPDGDEKDECSRAEPEIGTADEFERVGNGFLHGLAIALHRCHEGDLVITDVWIQVGTPCVVISPVALVCIVQLSESMHICHL